MGRRAQSELVIHTASISHQPRCPHGDCKEVQSRLAVIGTLAKATPGVSSPLSTSQSPQWGRWNVAMRGFEYRGF